MPRSTRRVLGVVVALACASTTVRARQAPERSRPLLSVDFLVVAKDGIPVSDLSAGDVSIRIGGRVRPVRSLQLVTIASTPGGRGDADALPPPFASNARSDAGRSFILAIDDDSFRPGREGPLRESVGQLIKGLTPRDRLALVTMPYGGLRVPFTTDHESVRRSLSAIVGNAPPAESGSALACRTRETLQSLVGFLDKLGVREEPAIVMFVTSGLAAPRHDAPPTLAPGMCELRSELFRQMGIAAGAARASFYVMQPGDAFHNQATGISRENIAGSGFLGSDNPIEGIEHLTGVTGGKMLQMTGSADTGFTRVLREQSAHYLVGVDADTNDRSGRSQQLDIRVNRPDVDVRARPVITFARPDPALGRAVEPSPRDMLSTATVFRDLPLRAAAFVSPGISGASGTTVRVTALAEPLEPNVKLTTLMAAIFDGSGKAVAYWNATAEDLARPAIMGSMPAPPGAYRLRVAAVDSTGRGGTADYDFETELPSTGPLTLSSILLGLSRSGTFVPKLQFADEPLAIAHLDLSGAAAGMPVSARLEIARTANGPALLAAPLAIEAAAENRFFGRGSVPIGALPPGDYVVRALVAVEGHPMTRVVRTLRKTAPPMR